MNETLKNILKIVGYIILAITGGAAGILKIVGYIILAITGGAAGGAATMA